VLANLDKDINLVDKDKILYGADYFKPDIAGENSNTKKRKKIPEREFPQLKKELNSITEKYE